MSVIDELLARNEGYAGGFESSGAPGRLSSVSPSWRA